MRFSISTVFITILTSNLLLVFISFVFLKEKILVRMGYKLLGVFLTLTVIRFLFPFELTNVSTNIYFPASVSKIIVKLHATLFYAGKYEVTIWNLLRLIWGIGVIISSVKYLQNYQAFKRYVFNHGSVVTKSPEYHEIVQHICDELCQKNRFQIVELPALQVPMICFFKKPYILLPCSMGLSDKEYYFILRHEMSHFFHHDLLIKFIIQLLSIFYWWNPACHILKRQCNTILEMRVDNDLTQKDSTTKLSYLSCLIKVSKATYSPVPVPKNVGLSFCADKSPTLSKRFLMLIDEPLQKRHNSLGYLSMVFVILALYICSFFFIFEAHYMPNSIRQQADIEIPTKENTYAIDNGDGTFDVYFQDEYLERTDSLQYYPTDLKIYRRSK